jgi:hypothetical protein
MVNRPNRAKPTKRSGFSAYKPPSFDQVKKIATQKGGRFDSIFKNNFDSWRPKEGSNQIRVLPPTWDGYEHYAYEVFVHKNVGADNSTYLCLNKNKNTKTGQPMGKPCPICNTVKRLKEDGDADAAKEIQVTQQYVAWISDRDAKKMIPPTLWGMSWTQNRDLAALCINERTGKTLPIAHAEEGYDVLIKRMGTGLNTKYVLSIDRDESAITDDADEMAELEEYLNENPVPSTLKFYDAEYLEGVVAGTVEEKDEDLDEKPRKKRSRDEEEEEGEEEDEKPRTRRRKASMTDDDEADEDNDTEEAADEDEEKPRARKGAHRAAEDEETEEEDEDEEKPRKSSRRRAKAEDDEETEEEDDEETKPTRGTRRKLSAATKRRVKEEEDDEPAEEEEEEEEEEKPRRRVAGRRR